MEYIKRVGEVEFIYKGSPKEIIELLNSQDEKGRQVFSDKIKDQKEVINNITINI